jgi:sigma-B regulation protein RsbU (phosphoserine phosphatase)
LSDDLSTEDFADLYETAPCGYVSLTPNGKISTINGTLIDWLGIRREDALGKSVHDILSFGGRIAFETHLAPLLRMQGHVHEIALDLVAADGTKIPTIANAAERRADDGRHQFTRLTLFKAVDRRKYERGLLADRARAQAESEAEHEAALLREQFIAVLGHDLRNPLSAVAAGIGLLDRGEQLSERGRQILRQMDGSIGRATGLIDDVLDFARGRLGGGIRVDRRAVTVTPVLEQVAAEIQAVAPDHRVDSRFAVEEPLFCDPNRLAQLASNLLSNAVTHGSMDEPVRFEARTGADRFTLSVANAGAPIPEAVRESLFEPFFRGAARPSRNGLGLGLFIASEIAAAHDGRLEVHSDEAETRFTFTMPRRAQDAGQA